MFTTWSVTAGVALAKLKLFEAVVVPVVPEEWSSAR